MDREHRRVILETRVNERVERPERLACDREARRAISSNGLADHVLEEALGTEGLLTENFTCLTINELMREAMAGDLVAGVGNPLHQIGRLLGHPPQNEEGAADTLLRAQLQNHLGVGLDAILPGRPAF